MQKLSQKSLLYFPKKTTFAQNYIAMNFRVIGFILGILLVIESFFMLLGLPFSLYYGDSDVLPILLSSGITLEVYSDDPL